MIPTTSSEPRFSAEHYLLYLRCPRSAHLCLTGEWNGTEPAEVPGFPIVGDRDELLAIVPECGCFPAGRELGRVLDAPPFQAVADVWHEQRPSGWASVLVRESTGLKQAYLIESAFLRYCTALRGEELTRQFVCLLNKRYVYGDTLVADDLLVLADVTRRVSLVFDEHRARLDALASELAADPLLEVYRDLHCSRPASCPVCGSDAPAVDDNHLSNLYRGGELAARLVSEGYRTITDVPEERLPHARQRIQRRTLMSGEPHVNRDALRRFMDGLSYPLHYLDFEAVNSGVPIFRGSRPWEHVPYLFSVHTEQEAGGSLTHTSFIMDPARDERHELVERLLDAVSGDGSVVVYGAAFEAGVLARLSEQFPDAVDSIGDVVRRLTDLLRPFNEFLFYDHKQRGKVSLKTILPILARDIYKDLVVKDGYAANIVYRHLQQHATGLLPTDRADAMDPGTTLEELVRYCSMDTLAMVQIMERLRELLRDERKG